VALSTTAQDDMTSSPIIIALTGGIGSGKSAVTKLFESCGASIVDADVLAREVVLPGSEGIERVAAAFPDSLILADGTLNRPKLASIIFSDPSKKQLLESILHPLIRQRWLTKLDELKNAGAPIIVYVIPLLFESHRPMPELQKIVLVSAPVESRIHRIMARDGFSREMAELRIAAQLPDVAKCEQSDFIICNDGSLEELEMKARQVFEAITNRRPPQGE
jgi:dephospho-CoA kinase